MEDTNPSAASEKCPYCGKQYFRDVPQKCSCGYYFNKEMYKQDGEVQQPYDNPYYGVKGWLLLLCLSMMIFSPLYTLYTIGVTYPEISPFFETFPGLAQIVVADLIMSAGLMIFSIYAGLALWNIKPGAVKTAKSYLLIAFFYAILASFLPYASDLPETAKDAMMPETVKGILRALVYSGVWYWFLNVSKRVKATYGLNGMSRLRKERLFSKPNSPKLK